MKAARHQSARLRRLHHESKFSKTIRRDRAGALHTRHGLQPSLHPCVHCWLPRGAAAAPPSTLSARAPAQVLKTRRTYHPFPVFRELRKMSHRDVSGIPRCPRPAKLEMRLAELRQAHQPRDAHLHAIIGARLPCGASTPAYTTSIYNMRGVTAALCC